MNKNIEMLDKIIFIIFNQLLHKSAHYKINHERRRVLHDLEPKRELIKNETNDLEKRLQTIIEIADMLFSQSGNVRIRIHEQYHSSHGVYLDCKKQYAESTNMDDRMNKLLAIVLVSHHTGLTDGYNRYRVNLDSPFRLSQRDIKEIIAEYGFTDPF
jgi:hypothetical protein